MRSIVGGQVFLMIICLSVAFATIPAEWEPCVECEEKKSKNNRWHEGPDCDRIACDPAWNGTFSSECEKDRNPDLESRECRWTYSKGFCDADFAYSDACEHPTRSEVCCDANAATRILLGIAIPAGLGWIPGVSRARGRA